MSKELLNTETKMDKETWKKVLNFTIELIKLIIAGFLGGTGANVLF